MFRLWTASYKWPTIPLKENFVHSELEKTCLSMGIQHTSIDLSKLQISPLKYYDQKIEYPNVIILSAMITTRKVYDQMKKLETSGCTFLNDVDSHYEAGDKCLVFKKLGLVNIPIPKTIFLKIPFEDSDIDMIDRDIGWPCVVKWKHGFANLGVSLCQDVFELYSIIKSRKNIAAEHKLPESYFDEIIVQKMLRTDHLIHVHSVGKIHHAVLQFHPTNNGFKSNLHKEGVINLPYKIDDRMIHMIESMMNCLKLDTVRTDIMLDGDSYKICEINPQASHGQATMVHLKNISDIVIDHAINKTTIYH